VLTLQGAGILAAAAGTLLVMLGWHLLSRTGGG
jgi:hypothetical protein